MTFVPRTDWVNNPTGGTPIMAADLLRIESGIDGKANAVHTHPQGTGASIQDYGAVGDGTTVNTTAIQNAIDATATAGGGAVLVPRGLWVTGPLQLKTGVHLVGEGWGSRLKLAGGSNAHFITLATSAARFGLRHLYLDGNGANQTAGDILHFDHTSYAGTDSTIIFDDDPNGLVLSVALVSAKGNGLYNAGTRGAVQYIAVWSFESGAAGFHIEAPDNQFDHCIAGNNGNDGFYLGGNGSSNRLVGCKSFLAGHADGTSNGYNMQFVSRIDLTHCEAQDNRGHGFVVVGGTQMTINGCRADTNGLGPEPVTGGQGDGIYVQQTVSSTFSLVIGDRNSNDGSNPSAMMQRYGYNCGTSNAGNHATLVISGAKSGVAGVGSWGANSVVRGTYDQAPLDAVGDTFNTVFTPTVKYPASSGSLSLVSGRLRLGTTSGYSNLVTPNTHDLVRGPTWVQLTGVPAAGTGTTQAYFSAALGSNAATIQWNNGSLQFKLTGQTDTTVTYNATNHAWLRIRLSDGNLLWETSPDRATWTTQRTFAAPTWTSQGLLKLTLGSGYYGTESGLSPAYAEFDNLNT